MVQNIYLLIELIRLQDLYDSRYVSPHIKEAFRSATLLSKGHGKLKDADELHSIFEEKCAAYNVDNLSFISDMDMHFDLAPTRVEADKAEKMDNI